MSDGNATMARRRLGRTGLEVSVIGIGTIRFGGKITRAEGAEALGRALDLGCNFVDTAHCYAKGASESAVGDALQGRTRADVHIQTRSERRAPEQVDEDIDTSLERIRTDYLDVFQLHDVTKPEHYQKALADGLPEVLQKAKADGRIRWTGISTHGSPELICEMIRSGLFDVITIAYNLIGHKRSSSDGDDHARTREEVLPCAAEHDVGVTVMKPLGGGVLGGPSEEIRRLLENRPPAERPSTTALSALLFAVADPRIHTVTPGVESVAEVEEDVLAGDPGCALSAEEVAMLLAEAAKWREDHCHFCGYCLPCPNGVPIPDVMRCEEYATRYGLADWARERYGKLRVKADACTECGECLEKCTNHLAIPERMKKAHALLG